MMDLTFALFVCLGLSLLGCGVVYSFQVVTKQSLDTQIYGLMFVGLAVLLHFLNLLQAIGWPDYCLALLLPFMLLGLAPFYHQLKQTVLANKVLWVSLLLVFLAYLFFLKPDVPMMAWDSWLGWEMKAKQWMAHGLSVKLVGANQWSHSVDGVYSVVAHYPDGLPLMYYFFQLFGDANNQVMGYLYPLVYFYVLFVLLCRFKQDRAHGMILVICGLMFLSMPLVNNHMNLQGYADLWLAMVLLFCVLALYDWNQKATAVHLLRLLLFLSLLPLFKLEGWVWLLLLLLAQFFSKFLIRRHRLYVVLITVVLALAWFTTEPWALSWAGRTVIISQEYIRLGHWFELTMVPVNVSEEIFTGLFLQNNWGLVWYFLPVMLLFWLSVKHPKHQQVTQTFFVLSFVAFLLLFFFTDAAKWAENFTAVNRVVLQLTPVFAYLLIQVLLTWQKKRAGEPALDTN